MSEIPPLPEPLPPIKPPLPSVVPHEPPPEATADHGQPGWSIRDYFAEKQSMAGLPDNLARAVLEARTSMEQRALELAPSKALPLEAVDAPWGFLQYLAGPEPIPPRPNYLSPGRSWFKEGDFQSQDYLFMRRTPDKVVFAVCDGVSKSFDGEFAAQYLGRGLVNRLWLPDMHTVQPNELKDQLHAYLTNPPVRDEANRLVHQVGILDLVQGDATRVPGQVERREKYGSHTVFATGRIDFDPKWTYHGRINLAWAGNTRIWVRHGDIWEHLTASTLTDVNRWTTKDGLQGRLSTWSGRVEDTDQILVYTDGLPELDNLLGEGKTNWLKDNDTLQEAIQNFKNPINDDYTLLDIHLRRSL